LFNPFFITPELNERVFALTGPAINGKNKDTDRTGMDMWERLLFAVVRLALNANPDSIGTGLTGVPIKG